MGMKFSKAYEAELLSRAGVVGPSIMVDDLRPVSDIKGPSTKVMNKLESSYASHLEVLKRIGDIVDWKYESVKLKIGVKTCWFCPDFWVIMPNGENHFHEVKGPFFRDDAKVKLKSAALQYPYFKFFLCQKDAGRWRVTRIE